MKIREMMFLIFFFVLFAPSTQDPNDDLFTLYWKDLDNHGIDIDHSAVKICFMMSGNIQSVDSNNPQKGYKCKGKAEIWVPDDKQAMKFCRSRLPYHIIEASHDPSAILVYCTFQINLKCDAGWFQILNKCYKVITTTVTFEDGKKYCGEARKKEFKPKLADYYEGPIAHFLEEMIFSDAWVFVPAFAEHYSDGIGKGVLILDGGYKYDTRPGTVYRFDLDSKHQALCEYTPFMEMAEMYLMASLYSEIYPIHISSHGASFSTSSYMTIDQTGLARMRTGKWAESFSTDRIRERCSAIGNIINVESHPLSSIKEEHDTVKTALTNHRFHLTSAFKNEGCQKTTYKDLDAATKTLLSVYSTVHNTKEDYCNAFSFSFHRLNRFPSMAAMRAPALCSLHSFSYEYGDCPAGWITAKRSETTKFCHYIYTEKQVTYDAAKRECLKLQAALTGFENADEFKYVKDQFGEGKPGYGYHFWLGGVVPCKEDCTDPKYKASWDQGVSRNTHFLNTFNHAGWKWGNDSADDTISFRSDNTAFHTHASNSRGFSHMLYICGKYPDLIIKKNAISSVKNKG